MITFFFVRFFVSIFAQKFNRQISGNWIGVNRLKASKRNLKSFYSVQTVLIIRLFWGATHAHTLQVRYRIACKHFRQPLC